MAQDKRFAKRLVAGIIAALVNVLCRIDDAQMRALDITEPLIIITNHINFLEVPILYTRLPYEDIVGISKIENWEPLLFRLLFNLYDVVPVTRGSAEISTFRKLLDALAEGKIALIAPEGTRSHHGQLQAGKPGVVFVAQKSGAPILPIAHYGGEQFKDNLRHLRRTDFHIEVGQPFHLDVPRRMTSETRQAVTDEIMYRLAALLPPEYRGVYADLESATTHYLHFASPEHNNLPRTRREPESGD